MLVQRMKGKIHRATVTEADLNYEGSITIGQELIDAAGLFPAERVQIVNVNNGERFETYVIPGDKGVICLNGPAARRVQVGDIIVIISYGWMEEEEARTYDPKVIHVNERNEII